MKILLLWLLAILVATSVFAGISGGIGGLGFYKDGKLDWHNSLQIGALYNPSTEDDYGNVVPSRVTVIWELVQDVANLAGADFEVGDWQGITFSVGARAILRGSTDDMDFGGMGTVSGKFSAGGENVNISLGGGYVPTDWAVRVSLGVLTK